MRQDNSPETWKTLKYFLINIRQNILQKSSKNVHTFPLINIINKFINGIAFRWLDCYHHSCSGLRWWFSATEWNTWPTTPSNEINFTFFVIAKFVLQHNKTDTWSGGGQFLIKKLSRWNNSVRGKRNWLPFHVFTKKEGGTNSFTHQTWCTLFARLRVITTNLH